MDNLTKDTRCRLNTSTRKGKKIKQKKYSDKLKDPRWQKTRLKVLERDGWKCRTCDDSKETLHVHHLFYKKDKDPWDYPNESLITLCAHCHAEEMEMRGKVQELLFRSLRFRGYSCIDIANICEGIIGSPYGPHNMPRIVDIIRNILISSTVLKHLDSELDKAIRGVPSIFNEKTPSGFAAWLEDHPKEVAEIKSGKKTGSKRIKIRRRRRPRPVRNFSEEGQD